MPDYKESTVTGTQWQRCCDVHVRNPLGQTPMVFMGEELATQLGDRVITNPVGGLAFPFDANEEIPLLNPATGNPTGEIMMMSQVYQAMWSVYMKKAAARDAAPQE